MFIVRLRMALRLILLTGIGLHAQIQITDDFVDGNHWQNPSWLGDTSFFRVSALGELQLTDSVAGSRYLSLASPISQKASWQWYCRMSFNPSSSNYLRVYLMSDQRDFQAPLNAYFVSLGGTTNDHISFYKQLGNQKSLLGQSAPGWLDKKLVELTVKVTRDAQSLWTISADTSGNGNFQVILSVVDTDIKATAFFGLNPHYTKTRADKFFFDDFVLSGMFYVDSVAPKISSVYALDSTHIIIQFNESMDTNSCVNPANYQLSQGRMISNVHYLGSNQVAVELSIAMTPKELYLLSISSVADVAGNGLDTVLNLRYNLLGYGDVLINEMMVDPSPSVGIPPSNLPELEYIELHNTLPWPLDLKNWQLNIGHREFELPDLRLDSAGYTLIAGIDEISEFGDSLPTLGIDLPSNALSNSGSTVSLVDDSGKIISLVSYEDSYYHNQLKAHGGWSLERINPHAHCDNPANWAASNDLNGGTPGRINSLDSNQFRQPQAEIESVILHAYDSLSIQFSVPINGYAQNLEDVITITPDIQVKRLTWLHDKPHLLNLSFEQQLSSGLLYRIRFSPEFVDCNHEPLRSDSVLFGLPQPAEAGDIVINEILFNPHTGGTDFVELLNCSNKILDLSRLNLGNYDSVFKVLTHPEAVASKSQLLLPHRYLCLSENPDLLIDQYPQSAGMPHLQVAKMPSMPDEKGSIALASSALQTLDYLFYSEDMHHALINDAKGVSLERLSSNLDSQSNMNWHSASTTSGFATPGYHNSQRVVHEPVIKLRISPKTFSPNMDGYKDLLSIQYSSARAGEIGKISIRTLEGQLVRILAEQMILGSEGILFWDGTNTEGRRCKSGIYIIVFESFNVNEKRSLQRGTCVLSP